MTQIVTRIPSELADSVDRLVDLGVVDSRSDAVRQGLSALIEGHRRQATAEAIVKGYEQMPQSDVDMPWSDSATVDMINQEPW